MKSAPSPNSSALLQTLPNSSAPPKTLPDWADPWAHSLSCVHSIASRRRAHPCAARQCTRRIPSGPCRRLSAVAQLVFRPLRASPPPPAFDVSTPPRYLVSIAIAKDGARLRGQDIEAFLDGDAVARELVVRREARRVRRPWPAQITVLIRRVASDVKAWRLAATGARRVGWVHRDGPSSDVSHIPRMITCSRVILECVRNSKYNNTRGQKARGGRRADLVASPSGLAFLRV